MDSDLNGTKPDIPDIGWARDGNSGDPFFFPEPIIFEAYSGRPGRELHDYSLCMFIVCQDKWECYRGFNCYRGNIGESRPTARRVNN
jgi:hypothetical protein|nr:hypothetical protein Q903MT_gene768 [Picea sitchensis]